MQIYNKQIICATGTNNIEWNFSSAPEMPEILIGVNIEIFDPVISRVPIDACNIFLISGSAGAAHSLLTAYTSGGVIQWKGRIPVSSLFRLVGTRYHARLNETMNLTIMTVKLDGT